ncbi:MAG TPA: hypothetical protein VFS21_05865 [Roseiflexaceae bacterium]|nr:hypothetical protein [Roseiflexaceae bacterium]
MPTFSTRLGRVPVLIAAGAIALVLFGLLLLASRPSPPPPAAQISPSAPPATVAPSEATLSAAQPAAQSADSAARPEPTNTPPPPKASLVASEAPAVAAAPSGGSGGSADTASATQAADAPQTEAGLPTIADGVQPRAAGSTTTVPVQAGQAASTQRYIDVAQRVAPPRRGDRPGSVWNARVVDDDQGHAVMLIMPLDAGANNAEFVRAAKERIAAIVNAMFLNDPQVIRVGVIGTFPNQSGTEVPAVSMIVNKAASPRWGQVSPTELEGIAQSLTIEQQFLP